MTIPGNNYYWQSFLSPVGTAGFNYSGSLLFTTILTTAQGPGICSVTIANLVRKDSFIKAVNLVTQMDWHFRCHVSQSAWLAAGSEFGWGSGRSEDRAVATAPRPLLYRPYTVGCDNWESLGAGSEGEGSLRPPDIQSQQARCKHCSSIKPEQG